MEKPFYGLLTVIFADLIPKLISGCLQNYPRKSLSF